MLDDGEYREVVEELRSPVSRDLREVMATDERTNEKLHIAAVLALDLWHRTQRDNPKYGERLRHEDQIIALCRKLRSKRGEPLTPREKLLCIATAEANGRPHLRSRIMFEW